jgi:hypothetical protein
MTSSIMIVRLFDCVFNNRADDIYITEACKLCICKGVANLQLYYRVQCIVQRNELYEIADTLTSLPRAMNTLDEFMKLRLN